MVQPSALPPAASSETSELTRVVGEPVAGGGTPGPGIPGDSVAAGAGGRAAEFAARADGPLPDYPAAHSMDTTWFAVDRDGHVAAFDSGEAGAVPTDAYLGEDWDEIADPLREAAAETAVIYDVDAEVHEGRGSSLVLALRPGTAASDLAKLDLFADRREVATSLGPGLAIRAEGVRYEELERALSRWHEADACLGCTSTFLDEDYPSFAHRGVYVFDHDTDNWIAGPYRRCEVPSSPIGIDHLRPALRRKVVQFDGRFAETRELQPVELWPSEAWGAGYLASDRKTIAAIPGKEAEFAKEAAEMTEVAAEVGMVVATPAGTGGSSGRVGAPRPARKPWWKRLFGG